MDSDAKRTPETSRPHNTARTSPDVPVTPETPVLVRRAALGAQQPAVSPRLACSKRIAPLIDLPAGSIAAVVGCGGKTSLIKLLAETVDYRNILVSTTTKMYPIEFHPQSNTRCLGVMNKQTGKLEAFPEHELAGLIPGYDVTLLEADGSKGLPCKGWRENEPVVPDFCTHTIGLVTISALRCAATEAFVHRLPEFLTLTGLREGGPITEQALESMVCAPGGMFKNSAGRRLLLVNQAESREAERAARSLLLSIKEKHPDRFDRMFYGSVHLDAWYEVSTTRD